MAMYQYKVTWLDHCGEKHESLVTADTITNAEIRVWEENVECLGLIKTVQMN